MSKAMIAKLLAVQNEIRALQNQGRLAISAYTYPKPKESDSSKIANLESRIHANHAEHKMQSSVNGLRRIQHEVRSLESKFKFPEYPNTNLTDSYKPIGGFENRWFRRVIKSTIVESVHKNRVALSNMALGNENVRKMHVTSGSWYEFLHTNMRGDELTKIQYLMLRDSIVAQKIAIAREIETIYLSNAIATPREESYTFVHTKGKSKGKVSQRNRIVYDSILSDSDSEKIESLYIQLGNLSAQLRGLRLRNRRTKFVPEYHSGKLPNSMTGIQFRNLLKSRARRKENKRLAEIAKIRIEREKRKLGQTEVAKSKPKTISEIQTIQKRVESRIEKLGNSENRYYAIQKLKTGEIVAHSTRHKSGESVNSWLNVSGAFKVLKCQNLIPLRDTMAQRKFSQFIKDNASKGIAFTDSDGNTLAIVLSSEIPNQWPSGIVNLPKF